MESKKKLKIKQFYSPWYGIIACLILCLFFLIALLPLIQFDITYEGSKFILRPTIYDFTYGFDINFGNGPVAISKFNTQMMIPLILILAALIFFLVSKFSMLFGFAGVLCLIASASILTQLTNFSFYGAAVQSGQMALIRTAKQTRLAGYYVSFISLYVISIVNFFLMIAMRVKAKKVYHKEKVLQEELGVADYYIQRSKKKKKKN